MLFHISTSDGTPIYLQIVQQVKRMVAAGTLKPGDELPAIRTLAEKLVINSHTVAHAYRELEYQQIVEKRSTSGTFISATGTKLLKKQRLQQLQKGVDDLIVESIHLSIPLEELAELVDKRIASHPSTTSVKGS
jgi:GntR family transcriptional regulator